MLYVTRPPSSPDTPLGSSVFVRDMGSFGSSHSPHGNTTDLARPTSKTSTWSRCHAAPKPLPSLLTWGRGQAGGAGGEGSATFRQREQQRDEYGVRKDCHAMDCQSLLLYGATTASLEQPDI